MNWYRIIIAIFSLKMVVLTAEAVDLRNRSTSSSGQFTIYCDNRDARSVITSLSEDTKAHLLKLFKESDAWRFPIVITLESETQKPTGNGRISMAVANGMVKIDVFHNIAAPNWREDVQRRIISAMILELAYRDNPPRNSGERFVFPPWWVVEGVRETLNRENELVFREVLLNALETEKIPEIEKFISSPPVTLSGSLGFVERAFATCLWEALSMSGEGGRNLARYVKLWPQLHGDPVAALLGQFPALSASSGNLDKWWMIQVARFGTSQRWQTLSVQESDSELSRALELEISADDKAGRTTYRLHDYALFQKLPGAKMAMKAAQINIATLAVKAHPLFRPVISEYDQLIGRLIANKSRGLAARLDVLESRRKEILGQVSELADYLNWYQATQMPVSSGAFVDYLGSMHSTSTPDVDVLGSSPEVTEYLNSLEKDFSATRW